MTRITSSMNPNKNIISNSPGTPKYLDMINKIIPIAENIAPTNIEISMLPII